MIDIKNKLARISFLARDEHTSYLLVVAKQFHYDNVETSKVLAIKEALSYVAEEGWEKVEVESDSTLAISRHYL